MTVEPEISPTPPRKRKRTPAPDFPKEELRQLVDEMRRQNLLLRRYLFLFGAGLAVLLILQLEIAQSILNYLLVTAIVLAVLLTAPWWSRIIVYLTDRIPWYPPGGPGSSKNNPPRE